jgi:hypothetical protein
MLQGEISGCGCVPGGNRSRRRTAGITVSVNIKKDVAKLRGAFPKNDIHESQESCGFWQIRRALLAIQNRPKRPSRLGG